MPPRKTPEADVEAPEGFVTCRVLKHGAGKIATGQHVAGEGDVHHEQGATFLALAATAAELEERHYVEVQD